MRRSATSPYEETFRSILVAQGRRDVPWQVAEAVARMEWGTLDARSRDDLAWISAEATAFLDAEPLLALQLAESYGLPVDEEA